MANSITIFKIWIEEFQYWREVLIIIATTIGTIIFWIKRTRDWLIKKIKWLYSKWPYTIIRRQKEEIELLKGGQLTEKEILILQLLWAIGIERNINVTHVMKTLNCKSQKAQHVLDKLHEKRLITLHILHTEIQYSMTQHGRDYIVNNELEISLDSFNAMIQGRNDTNKIIEQYLS